MSVSLHLQAFSGFDGVTPEWTVQPTSHGPGPFETYPSSIVFFTMTSVAFPKSIFSELAANLPRHACRTGESITMSSKGMWMGFRSAVPELALLLMVTVTGAANAAAATTHYIAANGSDSNNGSKTAPWQHAPGMPNCSGSCASYTPQPGDQFIFRGGDTWHFGNPSATPYTGGGWNLNQWWGNDQTCIFEGTQTGCIYYGVDQTWYSGSSWVRPIFTADNPISNSYVASCTYQVAGSFWGHNSFALMGVANVIDNIEFTGMCSSDAAGAPGVADTYIGYGGTGTGGSGMLILENIYMHGWSATSGAGQGSGGSGYAGTIIGGGYNGLQTLDHIVIDGSDSVAASWAWALYPSFYHFRDTIVRYTTDGVGQWCHDIHDNIFEHIVLPQNSGSYHSNILECNDDASGNPVNQPQNTPNVVYNNIVRHSNSNVDLWFCPDVTPEYWFNNLMYDTKGEGWSYAGPPIYDCPNTGGQYMFNNTLVDVANQPCSMGGYVGHGGQYFTVSTSI